MPPITRGQNKRLKAHSVLDKLPDELLLAIFSNLLEQDLCRVSQVCKRFHSVANDKKLWKTLYKEVFEYDLVLLKGKKKQFNFHLPADLTCANPWKMSMSHIYRGLHVRPGYQGRTFTGRSVKYFNTVQKAVDHACDIFTQDAVVVFLHAGTHVNSRLFVYCNVALIGAAPGTVVESVVLQCINSIPSGLFFSASRHIYLGHITLQVRSLLGSFYGGTGTLDHCVFHCLEDGPLNIFFNIQNGIMGFQTTHCIVMRPHGTKIQISSSNSEVVCIGETINVHQPLPANCPWVRQGLDLTKHNGSSSIAACLCAGDDSEEDEAVYGKQSPTASHSPSSGEQL